MPQPRRAVALVMPGSRSTYRYTAEYTRDGKLRFQSDRSIGIVDYRKGKTYYSSRGNTPQHLRNNAREIELPQDIVEELESVATLSQNLKKKLTGQQ